MERSTILLSLLSALVAVTIGQDMTSLVFQMMGEEPPPMPPQMPMSLRQHLYPQQTSQARRMAMLQMQRRLAATNARKAALMARRAAQVRASQGLTPKGKDPNPYSTSYQSAYTKNQPAGQNIIDSPANRIRLPGTASNAAGPKKIDNPYSTSRKATSSLASVRSQAMRESVQRRTEIMNQMKTLYTLQRQPKKVQRAKVAGCEMPEGGEMLLMGGGCASQATQMVCQMKGMTCLKVGIMAMCCPPMMNNLGVDAANYMKDVQAYVSEIA